ncbi:MAG: hypothetical protein JOZ90_16450 [Alphaproteobacteria bacterium]|nr:hypothetical protein [Alphaproteobacteria bacterium]MBV9372029.1 hypothetical protein [Alphaproteobacteria bacterium]MBV9902661.1 hypothetical protein [Alphaproteobacteria bacterium]
MTRYVGGSHFDPDTGEVNGSAFERTPKDTDGVSVTRCRFFSAEVEKDHAEIRRIVGSRLKLGKTAVFVELNTGAILDALASFEEDVAVVEDPLPRDGEALPNPAHALIIGFPFKGEAVGSLRSEEAGDALRKIIRRKFPAVA